MHIKGALEQLYEKKNPSFLAKKISQVQIFVPKRAGNFSTGLGTLVRGLCFMELAGNFKENNRVCQSYLQKNISSLSIGFAT